MRKAGRLLTAVRRVARRVGTWPPANARPAGFTAAAAPEAHIATMNTGRYMLICFSVLATQACHRTRRTPDPKLATMPSTLWTPRDPTKPRAPGASKGSPFISRTKKQNCKNLTRFDALSSNHVVASPPGVPRNSYVHTYNMVRRYCEHVIIPEGVLMGS